MSGSTTCSPPYAVHGVHAPDQIEIFQSSKIAIRERVGTVMLINEAIISFTRELKLMQMNFDKFFSMK